MTDERWTLEEIERLEKNVNVVIYGSDGDTFAQAMVLNAHRLRALLLTARDGLTKGESPRPSLTTEPNGESGDYSSFCSGCGDERDEPHTWQECVDVLKATAHAHSDHVYGELGRLREENERLKAAPQPSESDEQAVDEWLRQQTKPNQPGLREVWNRHEKASLASLLRATREPLEREVERLRGLAPVLREAESLWLTTRDAHALENECSGRCDGTCVTCWGARWLKRARARLAALHQDRDSWRRTAERLERERRAALKAAQEEERKS